MLYRHSWYCNLVAIDGPRAAGGTWTCLLANTPWPARYGHTTVIDAAGTIYLMGGAIARGGQVNLYNDVWVGTNNGANSTQGHSQSTHGSSRGTCTEGVF